MKTIENLNREHSPRTRFGANKFADLTTAEFKNLYLNSKPAIRDPRWPVAPEVSADAIAALPDAFDWRDKGAVTNVKDQGMCGSCWAFSTTGNVEGQWFLAGHAISGLSEQNLVDCDHECMMYEDEKSCDAGCDGGLQPNAYSYILKNGGIDSESSYPYSGEGNKKCSYKPTGRAATIANWTMVSQDEDQIAAYLVAHGPLAIAADAEMWQFYLGGVFYLPCGTSLDHGILIVGYGVETDIFDQQMPFWIIKNSWSDGWGESGYIRVERGNGRCGVNLFVSSSSV